MMKVVVIPADTEAPIRVDEVESINLRYLQKQVGGYIEAIDVNKEDEPEMSMYLNEEGKLQSLPYNPRASALAQDYILPWDLIAGDVVMTGGVDDEGESVGLSEEQVAMLLEEFEVPPLPEPWDEDPNTVEGPEYLMADHVHDVRGFADFDGYPGDDSRD